VSAVFFAIRQKSTGHFMPNYGSRKGRGGWTNDEPQPVQKVAPRLFPHEHLAKAALREWLKGVTYQVTRRSGSFEGVDDYTELKIRPVAGRSADDMEIVAVFLHAWRMTRSGFIVDEIDLPAVAPVSP
jgi:hypothetical protein